ncbi:hypothetical protein RJT34_20191 [Clitoria ternatea]|uniref:Uncharacterized protein n=1 Tax=Clitoria ternatea TaxID=43366 RepID=A0AAN9ISS1_CLITE
MDREDREKRGKRKRKRKSGPRGRERERQRSGSGRRWPGSARRAGAERSAVACRRGGQSWRREEWLRSSFTSDGGGSGCSRLETKELFFSFLLPLWLFSFGLFVVWLLSC